MGGVIDDGIGGQYSKGSKTAVGILTMDKDP